VEAAAGRASRALTGGAIALALWLLPASGAGAPVPETRTVDVAAEVDGAGRTPDEARREALARARDLAVAEATGIRVAAQQLRLKSEAAGEARDLFSYLVHTSAAGRIVREQAQYSTRLVDDEPVYRVALHAEVALEPGQRDPGFTVSLDTRPASHVLRAGEPLTMHISATRDCFVTVLNLLADGRVRRLFPFPDGADARRLPAGATLELPPADAGFEIRAAAGAGHPTHEHVLVVATLDPLTWTEEDAGDVDELGASSDASPDFTALNRWLLAIPLERRVEALWDYEVVE
jgi:uncharacterized protein DUF4384